MQKMLDKGGANVEKQLSLMLPKHKWLLDFFCSEEDSLLIYR